LFDDGENFNRFCRFCVGVWVKIFGVVIATAAMDKSAVIASDALPRGNPHHITTASAHGLPRCARNDGIERMNGKTQKRAHGAPLDF
jgi:hypothetical protein